MGRLPKQQNASHLSNTRPISSYFNSDSSSSSHVLSSSRTRLIDSYFQSNSKSATEPPPPLSITLGPFSSPEPGQTKATAEDSSPKSVISSDTAESDAAELITAEPLRDPFNSQEHGDWDENPSSPTKNTSEVDTTASEFLQTEDPIPSGLGAIDNLGFLTFSSQLSSESLRRLAVSPRKQKRKMEFLPGVAPSMPALSFSDKLAAEMSDSDGMEDNILSRISSSTNQPKALGSGIMREATPEENAENGSDLGLDTDWNDSVFPATPPPRVEEKETMKDAPMVVIDSDDDILTLSKFNNMNSPILLDESDSDLDDDPFSSINSGASSPTPMTTPSKDPPKDDTDLDNELSEDDEYPAKSAIQQGTRSSTRMLTPPRSSRNLRSATIKSKPLPVVAPRPVPKPVRANKRPILFSLDSLLKEKKRKDEIGYDIKTASNRLALDNELMEEYGDDEDEDSSFGPEMIPKGILSEEQEGALSEIIAEERDAIVEDVTEFFVHWPQELIVQPLEMELTGADGADHIVQKVLKCTQSENHRRQFLTSPFLMIMSSSPWTMPRSLFRWLVHVVATEEDQFVALSVFALLQRILSQRTSLLGVDHQDLMRVVRSFGAKEEYLDQNWRVEPVTRETRNERLILPETKKFPRQNLKAVIKLVNMTATLDPQFYDFAEIRKIMSLLLRMTTDPIIGGIKSLLGSTMVALLDAIPAHTWETERHRLCEDAIHTLGTSLPFMLLALNQLPSLSMRITLLRRSIALAYLQQPPIPTGETAPVLEELHRALFVDKGFEINSETNYLDLGRRMQVFGFCLDDEQMIASYGRKALEPMLKKLRMMHGKIVDIRAAFMERTLTKDIIQRLYMRLYYAGIHRQGKKH
ncbi:hypothetical protein EDD21DRAFT_372675 [Dissophora ornata]|nr:hypothetical protein EDD21DRAFT_372675 [Dissophora ornata]